MKRPSAGSFLQVDDFEELEHFVIVTNTTTGSLIEEIEQVEVAEFLERGLRILLPERSCAPGHFLILRLQEEPPVLAAYRKTERPVLPKNAFEVTVRVKQVEATSDGRSVCEMEFWQVDEAVWQAFIAQYQDRQERVSQLLKELQDRVE